MAQAGGPRGAPGHREPVDGGAQAHGADLLLGGGAVLPGADLDRLTRAVESLREAERSVTEAVGSARRGGASWGQISDIAGTTRQAAQRRWTAGKESTR